jgi:hypothetical protein
VAKALAVLMPDLLRHRYFTHNRMPEGATPRDGRWKGSATS